RARTCPPCSQSGDVSDVSPQSKDALAPCLTPPCVALASCPLHMDMRFGINTFLFTSPFTNESTGLFKTFKKWGFETVEIPIEDPSHIDPAHVKRELKKNKLVCGSACACMGPDRDLRGTPEQQKTGLDYMCKLLDQMVVLDCT